MTCDCEETSNKRPAECEEDEPWQPPEEPVRPDPPTEEELPDDVEESKEEPVLGQPTEPKPAKPKPIVDTDIPVESYETNHFCPEDSDIPFISNINPVRLDEKVPSADAIPNVYLDKPSWSTDGRLTLVSNKKTAKHNVQLPVFPDPEGRGRTQDVALYFQTFEQEAFDLKVKSPDGTEQTVSMLLGSKSVNIETPTSNTISWLDVEWEAADGEPHEINLNGYQSYIPSTLDYRYFSTVPQYKALFNAADPFKNATTNGKGWWLTEPSFQMNDDRINQIYGKMVMITFTGELYHYYFQDQGDKYCNYTDKPTSVSINLVKRNQRGRRSTLQKIGGPIYPDPGMKSFQRCVIHSASVFVYKETFDSTEGTSKLDKLLPENPDVSAHKPPTDLTYPPAYQG